MPSQNGDWVDTGSSKGSGGGASDAKQLQKTLAEKETAIKEQEDIVRGLTQKLGGLRQELNAAKSGQVTCIFTRYI